MNNPKPATIALYMQTNTKRLYELPDVHQQFVIDMYAGEPTRCYVRSEIGDTWAQQIGSCKKGIDVQTHGHLRYRIDHHEPEPVEDGHL